MLKGFRDFILRGNVVDLAVAVVIGAAFTAIVNALVADIINPLIAAIVHKPDFSALGEDFGINRAGYVIHSAVHRGSSTLKALDDLVGSVRR